MLYQLDVKRVNEKLLEKKPDCTAGVTTSAQGWPCAGFGDALLPAFIGLGSSKGCLWAGASFPIEQCTVLCRSCIGMVTIVL